MVNVGNTLVILKLVNLSSVLTTNGMASTGVATQTILRWMVPTLLYLLLVTILSSSIATVQVRLTTLLNN